MKFLIILIIFVTLFQVTLSHEDIIVQCISEIFTEYHTNVLNKTSQSGVPVIINNLENYKCVPRAATFLVTIFSAQELTTFLQLFACKRETTTKFLIMCKECKDIEKIFEILWYHFVINAMVITENASYTYNPLSSQCGNNISQNIIDMDCTNWINFSVKVKQYYGCSVKTVAVELPPYVIDPEDDVNPGYEVRVANEIAKKLNFSIKYIDHDETFWGAKSVNGSYAGLFHQLYLRNADLVIGLTPPNQTHIKDYSPTVCFTYTYINFYSPVAIPVSTWQTFFFVFDTKVWFLFAASAICMAFLLKLIADVRHENNEHKDMIECVFKIWSIIFSNFNAQPKSPFSKEVFVFWSVYCFIISSAFQSVLMSFLTTPVYEKQVSNIRELLESNLQYGGFYVLHNMLNPPWNEYYAKLLDNWVSCPLTEECLNRTANKRDFASYKNFRQVLYLMPYYLDSSGKSKIYQFEEHYIIYLNSVFTKNFPLLSNFDDVVLIMLQAGLVQKWEEDAQGKYVEPEDTTMETVPLTMDNLKLAFALLFGGYIISAITFLGEMYKFKAITRQEL